jgi:muramidase (phage lysozyme)
VYKEQLNLYDFTPNSQDVVALQQMRERGALPLLDADNVCSAIEQCSNIWASFPGNDYGQGGKSMEVLLTKYQTFLA